MIPISNREVKESVFSFISIVKFAVFIRKNGLCFMTSIVTFAKSTV